MSVKDFYRGEDVNQGLGAINDLCFSCVFVLLWTRFFLSWIRWTFLYLCNWILKPEVCDGANRWLTSTMWCGKLTILSVPKLIVLPPPPSLHYSRLTVLFIPAPPVVIQWLWCTLYCVLWVVYKYFIPFFIVSFSPRTLGHVVVGFFFLNFHVFWHFVGNWTHKNKLDLVKGNQVPMSFLSPRWRATSVNGSIREV